MSVPNSRPPTDSIKATGDAVTAANEPGRARAYAQVSPAASAVPDPSDALLIAAQPRGQVALAASPWTDSLRRVSSRSGSLTIGATRWPAGKTERQLSEVTDEPGRLAQRPFMSYWHTVAAIAVPAAEREPHGFCVRCSHSGQPTTPPPVRVEPGRYGESRVAAQRLL